MFSRVRFDINTGARARAGTHRSGRAHTDTRASGGSGSRQVNATSQVCWQHRAVLSRTPILTNSSRRFKAASTVQTKPVGRWTGGKRPFAEQR